MLIDIESGCGHMEDLDKLISVATNMEGNTICVLADSLAMPVKGFIPKFKDEFVAHIEQQRCPFQASSSPLSVAAG